MELGGFKVTSNCRFKQVSESIVSVFESKLPICYVPLRGVIKQGALWRLCVEWPH